MTRGATQRWAAAALAMGLLGGCEKITGLSDVHVVEEPGDSRPQDAGPADGAPDASPGDASVDADAADAPNRPEADASMIDGAVCQSPQDCPGVDTPCAQRVCISQQCGVQFADQGTAPPSQQVAGDCQKQVCNGHGQLASSPDETDLPNDQNGCTEDLCTAQGPSHRPLQPGQRCTDQGGSFCDGAGHCVQCNQPQDCGGGQICQNHHCVPPTCGNGSQDGDETDTDCGGSCIQKCSPTDSCRIGDDCTSLICDPSLHQCTYPNCDDQTLNGNETDTDCGGSCGASCTLGQSCQGDGDCQSGVCSSGHCGPSPSGPPSCAGGLTCSGVSCCQQILVPGGTFPMGRSAAGSDAHPGGGGDEQPEHSVNVATFSLDRFEVTVGRMRAFVQAYSGAAPAANAGAHPLIANSGWQSAWNSLLPSSSTELQERLACFATQQTWTPNAGDSENFGINCVDWYVAMAFCIWDGGRLPTEAEWEFAAAGGTDNRLYPWGSPDPDNSRANFDQGSHAPFLDVGSYPAGAGRWGHLDLAGNSWEWALDWYDGGWYSGGGSSCDNCANVASGFDRVIRGGSWSSGASILRATNRSSFGPTHLDPTVGFRCARTP